MYNVKLEEITLKEAVKLIEEYKTVFYFYQNHGYGNYVIHELNKESIITAIHHDATYVTPASFVTAEILNNEKED